MATRTPPAAPAGTKNVVPKGQSARMVKGRAAQQKVAANKAAVENLNAGKAAFEEGVIAILNGKATVDQVEASIKDAVTPKAEKAPEPTRDELVKEAQQRGVKGASGMNKAQLITAISKAITTKQAATPKERPVYRPTVARQQQEALKAWEKGGRKGDRPDTSVYDELVAEHNGTKPKATKRSRAKANADGTVRTRITNRSERGQEAIALRKASNGKRGPGKRLSEAELAGYIAGVKAQFPDAVVEDERPYAYWIEGLAFSRAKFHALWESTTPADAPKPAAKRTHVSTKAQAEHAAAGEKEAEAKAPAAKAPAKRAPRKAAPKAAA